MYIDWTYIVLLLPAMIFSLIASARVKSAFNKYSAVRTRSGITGAQAARQILDANGLGNVRIEHVNGSLTDHYDPKTNVVRLSDTVYDSPSTAAVGIACHEVGHALQYAAGYAPIKLEYFSGMFISVAYAGVILFAACTFFQLITLPIEYNASNRAMEQIRSRSLLMEDELKGAKSVLSAAALTYVAALAVSLMQLLRLLSLVGGRRRD